MDYEKLHKETLNKLQQMVSNGKITENVAKGICSDFVSESNDKRIIREILETLRYGLAFEESVLMPGATTTLKEAIAYLEKQKEQKSEWSEEDKKNLQGVIDEIEANKNTAPSYDIPVYDRFLSWLKSLRPHSCCELDTETRDALNEVINFLASHKSSHYNDYLFSIMNRLRQQLKSCKPHWKPSEEQMKHLHQVMIGWHPDTADCQALHSLYEDLKKL